MTSEAEESPNAAGGSNHAGRPAAAANYLLRVAIDYGTVNLVAAYHLKCLTNRRPIQIENVSFAQRESSAPQCLYWNSAKKSLQWGHEVAALVDSRRIQEKSVIRMPKLALYQHFDEHESVKHMHAGLKNISKDKNLDGAYEVRDLIADHLKSIMVHIKNCVADREGDVLAKARIAVSDLTTEVHISVPQVWDPASNETMAAAARAAGFAGQLVLEPQCVAAFAMHEQINRHKDFDLYQTLEESRGNSTQLVVDAGGGTVDLVKYKMLSEVGKQCVLQTVDEPIGGPCGSAMINEAFVKKYVAAMEHTSERDELAEVLNDLQLSDPEFRRQLSSGFEFEKVRAPPREERPNIIIKNAKGDPTFRKTTDAEIETCIQEGVQAVMKLVKVLIDKNVNLIIMSGGFGTSAPLLRAIKQEYSSSPVFVKIARSIGSGICHPVTHGALLRHEEVAVKGLPAGYCYFTARSHEYDPDKHTDAADDVARQDTDYDYPGTIWVLDRIAVLAKKNEVAADDEAYRFSKFTNWMTKVDNPELEATIYWAKDNVIEDSALQDLRRGIDYQELKKCRHDLDKKLLKRLKYRPIRPKGNPNDPHYDLCGRLVLTANGASVRLKFQLVRADKIDAVSKKNPKNSKYIVDLDVDETDVWESNFAHIPTGSEPLGSLVQQHHAPEDPSDATLDNSPDRASAPAPAPAPALRPRHSQNTLDPKARPARNDVQSYLERGSSQEDSE